MKNRKILVFGSAGLVGSSIMRRLLREDTYTVIGIDKNKLDLRKQSDVEEYFSLQLPDVVIIAAARVGGICANNTYRAQFIYDNLMIASNVIHSAYRVNVKKLIFLGSSCIYPKFALQPIKEEYLLSGFLEDTNEPYAIAKIAGIKLCENYYRQYGCNFLSVMPTNLYGPFDNFDLNSSHVLPALVRKIHEAKFLNLPNVTIWGSGKPKREFLFVDDLADSIVFILKNVEAKDIYEMRISHLNIGSGKDLSINELAEYIKDIVGYSGEIIYDSEKPDGTPRKLLDVSRLYNLGWYHSTSLKDGIKITYEWYLKYLQHNEYAY